MEASLTIDWVLSVWVPGYELIDFNSTHLEYTFFGGGHYPRPVDPG
jgi:hypothetical protein